MRNKKEMFDLILDFSKSDERVRAVILNGSRANPNAPKDKYQDYDIVYVVKELATFTENHDWIDVFGERLMLQTPETMRDPIGDGRFNWMMLLKDGNRIDLTLIPLQKIELIENDSLSIILLDKDKILPSFPLASDKDYITLPPSKLVFLSCCNNFWWCLQNVAKGIARDELPYAMLMYHDIVRAELHDMLTWYIGAKCGFCVSVGKMGKYFKAHLPDQLYRQYCGTYCGSLPNEIWCSVFTMCDLFHEIAVDVAEQLGFAYKQEEEDGIREYLCKIKNNEYDYLENR